MKKLFAAWVICICTNAWSTSKWQVYGTWFFDENVAFLSQSDEDLVKALACIAKAEGAEDLVIDGHASSHEKLPDSIAETRVNYIKHILLIEGVPMSRIKARSYGARNMVADERSVQRLKNRRVDFYVGTPSLEARRVCRKLSFH